MSDFVNTMMKCLYTEIKYIPLMHMHVLDKVLI